MCGIIGVVGSDETLATLLEGLTRLEYRGYDSAGIALVRAGQTWRARTASGTESVEALKLECEQAPTGFTSGIGHTRWATHGAPEAVNAHPHLDCSGNIAIIHNGIIENHTEIQDDLESRGHVFTSVTDSEVLAHLIEESRSKGLELMEAVRQSLLVVRGAFAVAAMDATEPNVIVAARRISPLVVGTAPGETYLASDVPAILDKAKAFYAVNDDEIVRLGPEGFRAIDLEGAPVRLHQLSIDWDLETAEKGGHDDFISKEINEQPDAIRLTLLDRRRPDGTITFDEMRISDEELRDVKRVTIVATGTSYHSALIAKYAIETLGAHRGRRRHRERVPLPRPDHRDRARWSSASARVARRSTPSRPRAKRNAAAHTWSRSPTSSTRPWPAKPTPSSTRAPDSRSRSRRPRRSWPRSRRSNSSRYASPNCAAPCRPPRSTDSSRASTP